MKPLYKKKAFTLVELMVAMVVAAIVILTVAAVLLMAYRSWNTNNAYVSLRRDAAFAVELMARDIRESKLVDIDDNTANQLILYDSGNVKGYTATYTRSGTNNTLRCTRSGGSTETFDLALGVETFDPVETNQSVRITLVMENLEFDISITNKTLVHVRN